MEANPTGATDIAGAVSRLTTALAPEPEYRPPEVENVPETVQEEPEQIEEGTETPEGDTETPTETYRVKVNGEEREVTMQDLTTGYMMESDYRQKTQSVAESRRALEAKAAQIDAQLAEAQNLVDLDLSALQSPEMQELKEYDREAYYEKFESVQKRAADLTAFKAKRQVEHDMRQQEHIAREKQLN